MKTISAVVEQYIKKKPFLQSALAQGIINLTSLSRIVKPEIEEELGKDVRNGAIVMALKRLSDDLEFRATHKIVKVLKNIGEITVRSNLTDYTFLSSETILGKQSKLLEKVNENQDICYTSSRGVIGPTAPRHTSIHSTCRGVSLLSHVNCTQTPDDEERSRGPAGLSFAVEAARGGNATERGRPRRRNDADASRAPRAGRGSLEGRSDVHRVRRLRREGAPRP